MMDRLTDYEIVGGHVHTVPTGDVDKAIMRLADYEDIGLMPDEIKSMYGEWVIMKCVLNNIDSGYPIARMEELIQADKSGRVMIGDGK